MAEGVIKRYELTRTWDVLYDVISRNMTDPLLTYKKEDVSARTPATEWIRNGFPNPSTLGKAGAWRFPLVVIGISNIDDDTAVLDASKDFITHSIDIECHATSRKITAQMAEEIRNILKTTAQNDLRKATLHGPDILGTTEDSDFIGSHKFYTKTMEYEFKRFD